MRGYKEKISSPIKNNPKNAYCVKITQEQLDFINSLIEIGEIFSLSEFVRFSLRVYFGERIDHFLFSSNIFGHIESQN